MDYNVRAYAEDQIRSARDLLIELDTLGLAEDEEAVAMSMESEVDFESVADELLKSMGDAEAMAEGIKKLEASLVARRSRYETRVKGYKALAHRILDAAQTQKMERPGGTISLRKTPQQLGDVDEASVPSEFWVEADPRIDRKALLKALKSGAEIEGVTLTAPSTTISIRK
jgi:hypothetical protein